MNTNKDILVASEVAEMLRVGTQRIYELCRTDPSFPVIKLGDRQYRWDRNAVLRWLASGGSVKGGEFNEV